MTQAARLLVVVNYAAARARAAWPEVRGALDAAGVRFDAHESIRPGETEARTRRALTEGYDTVAVVGGDGTLSAAASGFFQPCEGLGAGEAPSPVNPAAALALLPAGTGDDFARGLAGGRREPRQAWLGRLVAHALGSSPARPVDLLFGTTDAGRRPFVCLNAATLGIGAEVAARVAAQGRAVRRLSGEARFALAAVRSLAAWRNRRALIELDGRLWRECRTNLIAVVNGPFAGGGMNFVPAARPDDGLLDVATACGLSRARVVRELARVHRAGHLANPKVLLAAGSRLRIETPDEDDSLPLEADGDPRGHTPVELRVMPAALRVVF
ncbi:MAG TPA: diacylglycerol kinase family protein [Pyrinomonadaceae bacterium]|nr:diacylglycerol kinase family protein [Pyrinomonadaceae bacterium]